MIELKELNLAWETSKTLKIAEKSVRAVLELTESGCTIPFIARYRKEMTGNLDEVQISEIIDFSEKLANLDKRKRAILKSLEETGNYSDELGKEVANAADMTVLEDIYAPFKPGRKTKADKAVEAGLLPLAEYIMLNNPSVAKILEKAKDFVSKAFADAESVLNGAKEIIAQKIADNQSVRTLVRNSIENGCIVSKVKRGKQESGATYSDYFDFKESVSKITPHRVMALNRAEKEGILNISAETNLSEKDLVDRTESLFFAKKSDFFKECASYSLKNIVSGSLETETFNKLKETAIEVSLNTFHKNLEQILLMPPFGEKAVIGVDPGIRTGCKAALLDEHGNFVASTLLNLHLDKNEAKKLEKWITGYKVAGIAVGSGTFGREAHEILKSFFGKQVVVASVSEDGASVYSASAVAREEFPDLDITVRGAISIGRRFQDPLSELVKIPPESLGVGQYQHDIPVKKLAERLRRTVEWAVNRVGANLNTASPYLLAYISGLDSKKSAEIAAYRRSGKRFKNIEELKNIKGIGAKSFEQCAGFLRIFEGEEILDSTGVHPENYELVKNAAKKAGIQLETLVKNPEIIKNNRLIQELLPPSVIEELQKKGLDPREKFEQAEFSKEVRTINDLKEGMILNGIVSNITDFGAFVDIGIKEKGLLHISEIADKFIRHPSECLKLGQKVSVRIKNIDIERKRISLSMKNLPN
ncbi:helix-hairpin-helix domain-containing protein [bacterium]|nr:helix-hairpin-helix domain-containing protein [bacterium]MBQ4439471.1 helix-hairpin-helix domain-containing protein [bacterium]